MDKRQKIVYTAILITVALILSYIESIVSSGVILPGIKLGLSNIAVVLALYIIDFPHAAAIGILKCFISLLIFGRLSSLAYSMCGIILALAAMGILKKSKYCSLLSVSIGGSFFHIIGQLFAASFMLGSNDVWRLFPLFGSLAIVSGIITYIPEKIVLKNIIKINSKEVKNHAE